MSAPQAYIDPRRIYGDVVQALRNIPSLSPRTDVYSISPPAYDYQRRAQLSNTFPAHDTSHSKFLPLLHGTLPATLRGATYNILIHLWLSQQYPHQAPMVFIVPHKDLLIPSGEPCRWEWKVLSSVLDGVGGLFDVGTRKLDGQSLDLREIVVSMSLLEGFG